MGAIGEMRVFGGRAAWDPCAGSVGNPAAVHIRRLAFAERVPPFQGWGSFDVWTRGVAPVYHIAPL